MDGGGQEDEERELERKELAVTCNKNGKTMYSEWGR